MLDFCNLWRRYAYWKLKNKWIFGIIAVSLMESALMIHNWKILINIPSEFELRSECAREGQRRLSVLTDWFNDEQSQSMTYSERVMSKTILTQLEQISVETVHVWQRTNQNMPTIVRNPLKASLRKDLKSLLRGLTTASRNDQSTEITKKVKRSNQNKRFGNEMKFVFYQ